MVESVVKIFLSIDFCLSISERHEISSYDCLFFPLILSLFASRILELL